MLHVFQGDMVENIEQNISKSVDHIVAAKEQTKKAVRYQTKARKVMSFFFLFLSSHSTKPLLSFFPCLSSVHCCTPHCLPHLNHIVCLHILPSPCLSHPPSPSTRTRCHSQQLLHCWCLSFSLSFCLISLLRFFTSDAVYIRVE